MVCCIQHYSDRKVACCHLSRLSHPSILHCIVLSSTTSAGCSSYTPQSFFNTNVSTLTPSLVMMAICTLSPV